MTRELNFATPAQTILLAYCGALAAACLGFQVGARLFYRPTAHALRRSILGKLALWLGRLTLRLIDASKEPPQTSEPTGGAYPRARNEPNRFHPEAIAGSRAPSPKGPNGPPGHADGAPS
jgi:hypothetical protein